MPALDQTGPQGQGPMTGRGLGACGGGFRRGFGCGFGTRRYMGRSYLTKAEEIEELEDEAKEIEADLKAIKERVREIKGE